MFVDTSTDRPQPASSADQPAEATHHSTQVTTRGDSAVAPHPAAAANNNVDVADAPTILFSTSGCKPADDVPSASGAEELSDIGPIPSLPQVVPALPRTTSLFELNPGDRIADFEIERILGRGAFGAVYLARQRSLGRAVALKVAPNQGIEGRTMARLEHPSIVQVFSETVIDQTRLLCMQYVPGTTLEQLIQRLSEQSGTSWTGAELLATLEQLGPGLTAMDAQAFREREWLRSADRLEAICWISARLAEALDHAHRQGVLHRDIKPANTLVSCSGRPLLVDFNLAFAEVDITNADSHLFGGTLAYMAPEHLEAFNPRHPTDETAVTAAADVYSLGVMIFQLATGTLPFRSPSVGEDRLQALVRMTNERRTTRPVWPPEVDGSWRSFESIIARCLDPDPAARFATAGDLAQALDGCRELRHTERKWSELPLTQGLLQKQPWFSLMVFGLIPHFLGSGINITYNMLRVVKVDHASEFWQLVNWYNVIAYPLAVVIGWRVARKAKLPWRDWQLRLPVTEETLHAARRAALSFPGWAVMLACIGWLPGLIWFPLGLHLTCNAASHEICRHLWISIGLSALVALTYSYLGVQWVVLMSMYLRSWPVPTAFAKRARAELAGVPRRLLIFQFLAGTIPLAAAVLLLGTADTATQSDTAYRALVITMIVGGIIGFQFAVTVNSYLNKALNALASGEADRLK